MLLVTQNAFSGIKGSGSENQDLFYTKDQVSNIAVSKAVTIVHLKF